MSLKNRIKNNPWFSNKKYPILYFSATAVVIAFAIINALTEQSEVPFNELIVGLSLIIPFTVLFYVIYAVGKMLSVNFIIKNHRHTALFAGIFVGIIAIILFTVRMAVSRTIEIATLYLFVTPFVITVIYIVVRAKNGANVTLFSLGVMALLFGVMGYRLISFFLGSDQGATLFILGAGVLLAVAIFAIDIFTRKSIAKPQATLESLHARFEKYINRVFNGLPAMDELFELREQLSAALALYAEQNFAPEKDEYTLYVDAIDSLGDYSALLYPYKKNILARLSGSLNHRANIVVLVIMQGITTLYYSSALRSGNWSESFVIMIFAVALSFAGLFVLRIIENFRQKRHRITILLLGIIVIVPILIVFILISIGDDKDVTGTLFPLVSSIAAVAIATQIILNVITKKKKAKTVAETNKQNSDDAANT